MAKRPEHSCPNLFRIIDTGAPEQIAAFFALGDFQRLEWIKKSGLSDGGARPQDAWHRALSNKKKPKLLPLELEAARVLTVAEGRGQYALEGIARSKLRSDTFAAYQANKDELGRSLWTYLNQRALFEAVENLLHARLYRRYAKHYQTFPLGEEAASVVGDIDEAINRFAADVQNKLGSDTVCKVESFEVPASGNEPASRMYILFHPTAPTSARDMTERGERETIYIRPPGEATIVYTPSEGTLRVRADTMVIRQIVAERFAEMTLGRKISRKPVEGRAYDVTRFLTSLRLQSSEVAGALIKMARVIKIEVSVRRLSDRLSFTTTIDRDMDDEIDRVTGLRTAFRHAVAVRFVEIAIRYVLHGETAEKTLSFTISDHNSCSLLSLPDERERTIGHHLLRKWGILRSVRAPTAEETVDLLPVQMELWNLAWKEVSASWLTSRGCDPDVLVATGFIEPCGWQDVDLIEEDGVGMATAHIIPDKDAALMQVSEGQEARIEGASRYRLYRIDEGWLSQFIGGAAASAMTSTAEEALSKHLKFIGFLDVRDDQVPLYLARRLEDERIFFESDQFLRARSDLGLGLVLSAGRHAFRCLGANVLAHVGDHISAGGDGPCLDANSLREAFMSNRQLARGGQAVEFSTSGDSAGELFIPGKGTAQIIGETRVRVVRRLHNAYKRGAPVTKAGDLNYDLGKVAIPNIFGKAQWSRLEGTFIRSAGHGYWELAI